MKLLVVGASGFLGRNIAEAAAKTPWDLAATYWKSKRFPTFAASLGCEAIRHDLLGEERSWDADVCIYLAGNSSHRLSVESPLGDLKLNLEALNRFLGGFTGGLVFMSSAAVYDGSIGPVSPETPTRPQMPYAITKLAAEGYLTHYAARGHLAWRTILRLYYAYGPHDHPYRLIPRLVRALRDGERRFAVTAAEGSLLDPLYAPDVAQAALAAAEGRAQGQILDLCAGEPRAVADVVREVLRTLSSGIELQLRPDPDETPVRFHSDPDPCLKALGLGPFHSFPSGLRGYLDWAGTSVG